MNEVRDETETEYKRFEPDTVTCELMLRAMEATGRAGASIMNFSGSKE